MYRARSKTRGLCAATREIAATGRGHGPGYTQSTACQLRPRAPAGATHINHPRRTPLQHSNTAAVYCPSEPSCLPAPPDPPHTRGCP
eukprot:6566331-Prymnesium_polylepis.2